MTTAILVLIAAFLLLGGVVIYGCCVMAGRADDQADRMHAALNAKEQR